jgi:hypothetical protein
MPPPTGPLGAASPHSSRLPHALRRDYTHRVIPSLPRPGGIMRTTRLAPTPAAVLGLALGLAAGCGPAGPPRYGVTGEVTFQGQPLEQGSILFAGTGGTADRGGAPIMRGRYEIPAEQGLTAGHYLVQISSGDPARPTAVETEVAVETKDGPSTLKMTDIVGEERIPAEFNTGSKHVVEVRPGTRLVFNFSIP